MKYSSPLKLFPELDQMNIRPDASFLANLKKRMLAEFQLNGEMPLQLNGNYYSKDEILQLLDKLKEQNSFAFHHTIWKDKDLLNFLEHHTLPQTTPSSWESLKNDEAFVNFVSPYFAETYSALLAEKFKQGDSVSIKKIVQLPVLATAADEPGLYTQTQRSTYRQIKELHLVIEQLETKTYKENAAALKKYYEQATIISLNALPDTFASFRSQYSIELINLYVQAYNSLKRPELAEEIIIHAVRLSVGPYERSLLDERMEEIKKLRKGSSSGSGDNSAWVVLKVIGIVIYVIIMIARGCGTNRSSSYNSNPYNLPDFSTPSTPNEFSIPLTQENNPFAMNDRIISGLHIEKIRLSQASAKISSYHNRPETGEEIYVNVDSIIIEENNTASGKAAPVNAGNLLIVNNGPQDAAILIASEKAVHRFLRKNDSLLFTNMPQGKCEVIVYSGHKWNPGVCFHPLGISYRCCGMFDPLSSSSKIKHDKSVVFFSDVESKHRIELQDTSVVEETTTLSQKKLRKMDALKRVIEF